MTAAFVFATRSMCASDARFLYVTWISGKQVGYCYGCTRKLNLKRKFSEGKRVDAANDDRREPSSDRDLETSERSVYDF